MNTTITSTTPASSKGILWTGRILSGLVVLFLLFDAILKIFPNQQVLDASAKVGWTIDTLRPLGIVLLLSTILYIIPRTALIGAILVTAYLGGAVASSLLSHMPFYFPVIFGVFVWVALGLTYGHHRRAIFSAYPPKP